MKIPDLSKIDIKDIDVAKIKNEILQHKEIAIQVGLVVGSIVIALSAYNSSRSDIAKYKSKIAALQAKTGAIEQYNQTQTDVKSFLNKVPSPVSEDKMINLVTDFAGKNGVKILTFTQADVDKKETLTTTSIAFSLLAESFSNVVRFIADIEKSKDFLQMWSCSIEPQSNANESGKNDSKSPINFRVQVTSLKVEP